MITSIIFRGSEVDIKYKSGGYEEDVNAEEIEWKFLDEDLNKLELTSKETDAIILHLAEAGHDARIDDEPGLVEQSR